MSLCQGAEESRRIGMSRFCILRQHGSLGGVTNAAHRYFCFPPRESSSVPVAPLAMLLSSITDWIRTAIILTIAATVLWAPPALAIEERVALVIGNDAYPTEPLKNAVNDAQQVAK